MAANLRDTAEMLTSAVAETLDAIPRDPKDAAARKLAADYAAAIDACASDKERAWSMRWLAPLLLDCLESLGATPRSRKTAGAGGKPADAKPSGLAGLRAAHRG